MKSQLIAIVAAVLVVGCGESQQQSASPIEKNTSEPVTETAQPERKSEPDYSGSYIATFKTPNGKETTIELKIKPDNSFIGTKSDEEKNKLIGKLKTENDLLVFAGHFEGGDEGAIKIDKTTLKLVELSSKGRIAPLGQVALEEVVFKKN